MSASLIFTDTAATKVKELIIEEGNPDLKLRIYIEGGGCSGFKYNFTFDEAINDDDTVIEKKLAEDEAGDDKGGSSGFADDIGSVKLLVDSMSVLYLTGATIDYREDINGAQFVIKNPNAKTTCGCGSSFTV